MGPSSLPSVYPGVESRGAGACLVLSVRAACSLASELLAAVLSLPGQVERRGCLLLPAIAHPLMHVTFT